MIKTVNTRWVRAEVEFKANDRVIPFDVLKDPSAYFMGAYPVFADLFDYERINKLEIIQKTAEITLKHSFDVIKHQFGKYFSYYSTFMSLEEILNMIKVIVMMTYQYGFTYLMNSQDSKRKLETH